MTEHLPSDADDDEIIVAGRRRRPDRVRTWNRKLHYYLGLYLLQFLWLFAISGLTINHPKWSAAKFWSRRVETVSEHAVSLPNGASDDQLATAIMRSLGIVGEPGDLRHDATGKRFEFQVVKPGHNYRIAVDLAAENAKVTEIRLDRWGAVDAMHKLTGVRLEKPEERRDWILTRLWSLAMDALAVGLLILVGTGLYLWYRLGNRRMGGIIVLTLGLFSCGFFLFW
jgi:hypothetical protein